ncbi:MAG: hypothetical protein HOP29_11595 [Phycisphaerales bacterium]|nr:hypothetical protein [Phycisphaerales bacterium]
MNLATLVVHDAPSQFSSLTHSLFALLRGSGIDASYDDLHAALGLSFRMVAAPPPTCPAQWFTYGEDLYLEDTAALYGVQLRPLHPRAAAAGLDDYDAYRQHFLASYVPLIRTALAHDQAVLAWRGWPDAGANDWGIVTTHHHFGMELAGTTVSAHGHVVPLLDPPHQCYVVEQVDPRQLRPLDILSITVARAIECSSSSGESIDKMVVGPAAWNAWLERVGNRVTCPAIGHHGPACHIHLARIIIAARESALRFFQFHRDELGPQRRTAFDTVIDACGRTVTALRRIVNRALPMSGESPEWRELLLYAAETAGAADADALRALHEWPACDRNRTAPWST